MKNIRSVIYIILIIVLTSLGTLGLINAKTIDDNKVTTEPKEDENTIILKDKNLNESKYELLVHMNNDISCQNEECEKLVIIKTKTPNAKILDKKDYANYILIYDEVIKLIDLNTRNFEQINIDYSRLNTYSINLENESEIETENQNKKVLSITYNNSNTVGHYDYKTKKNTQNNEYQNIKKINNYYINTDENNKITLINIKGETLFTLDEINTNVINKITEVNNLIHIEYNDGNNLVLLTYNLEGTRISRIRGAFTEIVPKDSEIYAYSNDTLTIYNTNGKVIKVLDLLLYNVKYIYESLIFGIKNKNLIVINLKTNDETEIVEITNKVIEEIEYKQSGKHSSNKNKPGIYITLKSDTSKEEYVYNLKTETIENFSLN